jgi:hypothetical protein
MIGLAVPLVAQKLLGSTGTKNLIHFRSRIRGASFLGAGAVMRYTVTQFSTVSAVKIMFKIDRFLKWPQSYLTLNIVNNFNHKNNMKK